MIPSLITSINLIGIDSYYTANKITEKLCLV